MSSSGLLISFDGLDSSGKATQTKLLHDRLHAAGHIVPVFATPDYTMPSGQELRARLQDKLGTWANISWQDKMRLFAANRAEHKDKVITSLASGAVVVYDRYVPSSLAFITVEAQAQQPQLTREEIHTAVRRLEHEVNGMPVEDCSFFLDLSPLAAASLLLGRKIKHQDDDEYTDQLAIQEKLYREYERLVADDPRHYLRITCSEAGSLLKPEIIADRVWQQFTRRFPQLSSPHLDKNRQTSAPAKSRRRSVGGAALSGESKKHH